ncbi:MAG: hypothetical protein R3C16_00635 [Hyphomonadaceae bacterium]
MAGDRVLCITYAAVSSPFSALRRASYATVSGRRDWRGGDDFVTFVIVALVGLFSWLYWARSARRDGTGLRGIRDFAQY